VHASKPLRHPVYQRVASSVLGIDPSRGARALRESRESVGSQIFALLVLRLAYRIAYIPSLPRLPAIRQHCMRFTMVNTPTLPLLLRLENETTGLPL